MTSPIVSIGIATGVIGVLLCFRIWRLFRPGETLFDHPAFFLSVIFLSIIALRAPQIIYQHEINPDESQMLAQGMRYLSHPVPWRDVDGTTSGPLDSWFLSLPILLGFPADWTTARAMLLGGQLVTLIFIYLALRCFVSRGEAQLALVPTVLFYAFVMDMDAVHYSSETVPVVLLSMAAWLLCRGWMAGRFSNASIFATAFLAGCLPFAKLQATPLAMYLGVAETGLIIFLYRKTCAPKLGLMCLGGILFPAVLLGIVAACGAASDFWTSYILGPAGYTQETFAARARAMWFLFSVSSSFRGFFVSAAICGILVLAARCYVGRVRSNVKLLVPLAGVVGLGLLTVWCMMEAGKPYLHYLLLLIPAQGIFFGVALAFGKSLLLAPEEDDPYLFPRPVHWFLGLFALAVCVQMTKAPAYYSALHTFLAHQKPYRKSFVARRILSASQPGDTLSVWGWAPTYYVETGLIPATRDAIGHFMIENGRYQNYYRQRYLGDLKRHPPAFFIDAMAGGIFVWNWSDFEFRRHESFPELAKFVDQNYSPWLTVHIITADGPALPIRVYVKKSRMVELKLYPQELNIPKDPLLAPD